VRKALGRELGKLHPVEADVVIPVPDSGVPAAIGFSEVTGIPFDMAFTRSHYVGRSFIQPQQNIRNLAVRLKLATATAAIKNKRVVVVDDSLVRGTTSKKIVNLLRAAGAKEVHLRISAPPTISPCFYGIDMPTKGELIAAVNDLEGVRKFVGADTIGYVPVEAMRRAVGYNTDKEFCEACFTGDYPVPAADYA
jgi:amidophosphoribosyltransferase